MLELFSAFTISNEIVDNSESKQFLFHLLAFLKEPVDYSKEIFLKQVLISFTKLKQQLHVFFKLFSINLIIVFDNYRLLILIGQLSLILFMASTH